MADLEERLLTERCSEEKKNRQLQSLGRKESQYLRLRRTRLGLDDFVTVKVIGKGAFGEVKKKNRVFAELNVYFFSKIGPISTSV